MTDLNTQEQETSDVKVNNEEATNVETSDNKTSTVEIDKLKEEMRQTNSSMKHIEELISHRLSETKTNNKNNVKDLTKSIIEDSIVDPDKAQNSLETLIVGESKRATDEALLKFRVEQEASKAVNEVISKTPALAPLIEDIKHKAGRLIHSNPRLTIAEAISQASSVFKQTLSVGSKKAPKEEISEGTTEGHKGNTHSNATTTTKQSKIETPEQELDGREDARLNKII